MTKTDTSMRTIDTAELDTVAGGLVTMLYDVTVAGIRYTGWMNDSNGSWTIDVGGNPDRGYVSHGGFNPND